MAGDILIIDGVATNHIVLKVNLLASQYRVRPCATLNEARTEIAASLPDLILLDISNDAERMHAFLPISEGRREHQPDPDYCDRRVQDTARPCRRT